MNPQSQQPRLSAIVLADVVGYTRLVEQDTEGTVKAWKAARDDVIHPAISERSGRVVKLTGDGFLAEFTSVVDAVTCAVAIQDELSGASLKFRIGVHLGDVIDDGEDIHGEGVNIAARIEALAEPGGICVSAAVHEQVRNRVSREFRDLGEHEVKHVTAPVRVYSLSTKSSPLQDSDLSESRASARPSIAVLPFDNMSGDVEQQYFSDGITEDIITALSRFHDLFVIARNSSFAYRGLSTDIRQVGRELDVQYVLEGSVRKSGPRVRVTAQLIETATGNHVWAERFDRELEDVFVVQDEITESVATAVGRNINVVEGRRARSRGKSSLAAWELTAQADWYTNNPTKDGLSKARLLCTEVIERYPDYGPAHGIFAFVNVLESALGFSDRPHEELLGQAEKSARRAIELDPDDERARTGLANVLWLTGKHEEALQEGEMALRINPNYAVAVGAVGNIHATSGKASYDKAITYFDRVFRLSPHDPALVYWYLYRGLTELFMGNFDATVHWCRKSLQRNDKFATAYRVMTAAYSHKGESDKAVSSFSDVERNDPGFTIQAYSLRVGPQFKNAADLEYLLDGLRAAGAKES